MEILAQFVQKSRDKLLYSRTQHGKLPGYRKRSFSLLCTGLFSLYVLTPLTSFRCMFSLLCRCRNLSTCAKCLTLLFQDHKMTLLPSQSTKEQSLLYFSPGQGHVQHLKRIQSWQSEAVVVSERFFRLQALLRFLKINFFRLQLCTEAFSIVFICFS